VTKASVQNVSLDHTTAERPAVRTLDPLQFQLLVALLFEQEGFQVERTVGANPENGMDFLAANQGITFGVKCKHWKASWVGVEEVHAFLDALHSRKLANGFMVTLEGFTDEALELGRCHNLDLMDETMLIENLEAVQWRSNPNFLSLWDAEPKTCPKCESPTILRVALKREYGGKRIWGCSTFPNCNFTLAN
jgi:restriction system protein